MKNLKYIVALVALVAIPALSFAAWSAPTAAPTSDNTQPPLNISTADQEKLGTITAKGLCVRLSATTIRCLGETPGNTPSVFDFPWIQQGNNIVNTNTGNVLVNPLRINNLWGTAPTERLTVGGKVKAEGLCLGLSCIDINTGGTGDTVNNWKEAITSLIGGTGAGAGTVGTLAKFTGVTTLGDSS
ncbi:MAG TPA: hypothetical protein P5056_03770, partial [Candidatus Paceibacterota bacterium]|nr:hypothetical protein [Candidatus Paceibacterota bacterium]